MTVLNLYLLSVSIFCVANHGAGRVSKLQLRCQDWALLRYAVWAHGAAQLRACCFCVHGKCVCNCMSEIFNRQCGNSPHDDGMYDLLVRNLDIGDIRSLYLAGRCAMLIEWGDTSPLALESDTVRNQAFLIIKASDKHP